MSRAVSTIIAAIFVIMALILFLIYMVYVINSTGEVASKLVETINREAERGKTELRTTSVIANTSGIYLWLRNEGTVTAVIEAYSVRDELTNEVVRHGTFTQPYVLQPGESAIIHVPGSYSTNGKYLISLAASNGAVVKTQYPLPTIEAPVTYLANQQLPSIASEGTETWSGKAVIPIPHNTTSNITYAEANNQVITDPSILKEVDNISISITGIYKAIIVLQQNNTLLYEDFTTNPIGVTFITNTNTWEWGATYGYEDGGIYQTSESTDLTTSREIIGYFNTTQIPLQQVYIASKVYHIGGGSDGYIDIILYLSEFRFYTLGTYEAENSLEIWRYSNEWRLLAQVSASVLTNTWLAYHVIYNPTNGFMNLSVYDLSTATPIGSVNTIDTQIAPTYVGLGTYGEDAMFDDVLISLGNTRFVNVTGVPANYTVELWSNGVLVASAVSSGPDVPVVLDVTYNYSLRNAEFIVRDTGGDIVTREDFNLVLGGNVYRFMYVYEANVTAVTKSDISNPKSLYICTSLTSNTSINASIYIYDFTTNEFRLVSNESSVNSLDKCYIVLGDATNYINATNNSVIVLIARSSSPFNISIDQFNTVVEYEVPEVRDVLIVGVGGTSRVDVYELGFNGVNVTLRYIKSLDVHSLFDGRTDITYDSNVTESLILVNATGVYSISLYSGAINLVRELGDAYTLNTVKAEIANNSLLIVKNYTSGVSNITLSYVLINLSSGEILASGVVDVVNSDVNVSCSHYCSSASDGLTAYFLMLGNYSGSLVPVITFFNGSGWYLLSNFTGYRSTGMCWGGDYLYIMLEMGGVYRVSTIDGSFTPLNINLPYYPRGFGDRLECYSHNLIFVRDDGTSEVWVTSIPTT